MARDVEKLPADRWAAVVRDTPLVSIDLIVEDPTGCVLLGLRRNRPAKDRWFVPGGVIRKNERLDEAFERLTEDELGRRHPRSAARLWGVYEHLYEDNALSLPDFGTHYVVLAHHLPIDERPARLPAEQHDDYRWSTVDDLLADDRVHPYTKAYFQSGA